MNRIGFQFMAGSGFITGHSPGAVPCPGLVPEAVPAHLALFFNVFRHIRDKWDRKFFIRGNRKNNDIENADTHIRAYRKKLSTCPRKYGNAREIKRLSLGQPPGQVPGQDKKQHYEGFV